MTDKMKELTPLMKAIEAMKARAENQSNSTHVTNAFHKAIQELTALLPTEREFAETVWEQSYETATGTDDFPMGGNTFKYPDFATFYSKYERE